MFHFARGRILVLVSVVGLLFAPPAASQPLADRIDTLLNQGQVDRAFWGISIYDLEEDSVLYQRNPERGFLPASNQKLLTTAAALDILGSTHRYETTLAFDGTTRDSVMHGDLRIIGSGDPTFGSTTLRAPDPLRTWAERLAEMGVRRIEGRLIGDDDAFSDWPYPDGWNVNYLTRQQGRQIGVSASGLSYFDNVVPVTIRATSPGEPPDVYIDPEGIISVENRAVTSERWRGSTLQVSRTFSTNEVVLSGSVARSYEGVRTVPLSNPTVFTLRAFQQRLQEAGIETDLQVVDIDDLEDPGLPGRPLFVELSPPLSEIVEVTNKQSNNFYAEQVFRTYGWGGSARGAARRTESFLRRAGIDTRLLTINDGSGLSRKDVVTPEAMRELLVHMNDHQARAAFFSSLPRGGERNTTLDYRLAGVPVWAKTGSLAFVRALSGYVEQPNGSRIAFAMFANNYTGPSYQITRTIDDIIDLLTGTPS